jgi:PadR family transcriptional regulator PadR
MVKKTNPDFLNGVPELVVLQLLSRRPMYGYELLRAIEHTSGRALEFGEGCIYPILHRLEKDGHLGSSRETVGGRSRVVYRILPSGRKRLRGRVAAWQSVAAAINLILTRNKDGRPSVAG